VLKRGDFRLFNRFQPAIASIGNQITDARFTNSVAVVGDTVNACKNPLINFVISSVGLLKAETHPDNGKHAITPSGLHLFQLSEGRLGPEGQVINMTLNSCTSQDRSGHCNAPASPTTAYIFNFPVFDASGNYTVNTQIFPSYYVYEDRKLVQKIPQHPPDDFIKLNSSSQVKASEIK
jgi:hypothetical protein